MAKTYILDDVVDWDLVKDQGRVMLYHTLKGPLMGTQTAETERHVTLFAPAMVVAPTESQMAFMPVLFVEKFIWLYKQSMFGQSPFAEVVRQGYASYFKRFSESVYTMRPVVVSAGVDVPSEILTEK